LLRTKKFKNIKIIGNLGPFLGYKPMQSMNEGMDNKIRDRQNGWRWRLLKIYRREKYIKEFIPLHYFIL